ncbi:MAG TPA: hypothetical protein VG096_01430 [Bryobacteraceae bacterium]|nr:hypothetical protein [Bryobacteraceae bacterium]
MILAAVALMLLFLPWVWPWGTKTRPVDREVLRQIQRADQRRGEFSPYE